MEKGTIIRKARYFGAAIGLRFSVGTKIFILEGVDIADDALSLSLREHNGDKTEIMIVNEANLHTITRIVCVKKSFESFADADRYLAKSSFTDEEIKAMKVYKCRHCDKYHLTSNGMSGIFKKYRNEIKKFTDENNK